MRRLYCTTVLLLSILLIATLPIGCGSTRVCSIQQPTAIAMRISAATVAALEAEGILPDAVADEYARFVPCAGEFLGELEKYCSTEDAEMVRQAAMAIRTSRDGTLCTAADVVEGALLVLDAVVTTTPDLPSELLVTFRKTVGECGGALVSSLREHGNC